MNVLSEKLEIMELLLKTENEDLLRKIKSIFRTKERGTTIASRKNQKDAKVTAKIRNGNSPGFTFNWEGGLKELRNKYDSVNLQHHINSLRK
jgi:hypothetical protein